MGWKSAFRIRIWTRPTDVGQKDVIASFVMASVMYIDISIFVRKDSS